MYYEIYIDQLFLENLIILVLILKTWEKTGGFSIGWKKIWEISFLGAVAVCAVIFFRPEKGWIVKAGIWCLMFLLCIKTGGGKTGRKILGLLGVTAFYAGAFQIIISMWEPPVLLAAVLAYMAMELLKNQQRQWMVLGEYRTEIALEDQGDRWELTALIDTGNHLTEPLTGRPVSILSWQEAEKLQRFRRIQKEENGYLYIPFHSVGTEKGWMMGMVVDAMIIKYRGKEIRVGHPVLAVSREILSTAQEYQMILNPLHILGGR